MHIYGTDINNNPGKHFLVQSFFNGYAGCNQPGFALTQGNPGFVRTARSVTPNTGLTLCDEVYINTSHNGTYNADCGPYTSITGGSNLRLSSNYTDVKSTSAFQNGIEISPNPVKAKLKIVLDDNLLVDKLKLFSSHGTLITVYDFQSNTASDVLEIDFSKLGVNPGIYFLQCTSADRTSSKTVIYAGE